jgi:type IV secretion system protein TrbL
VPGEGWGDLVNPFTALGNAAGKVAADAWTAAMLSFWNAGLWFLQLVLGFIDTFLTPDLRESGPVGATYRTTFWVAVTLVVALTVVQSGVAAFRRDGRSVARLLVGSAQFVMVWAAWVSYVLVLLYACSGLTKAIMAATMGVDTWARGSPGGGLRWRTSATAPWPPCSG